MNQNLRSLVLAAAMGMALVGAALAADTSTSIVARKATTPVGTAPVVSTVEAQATSGAASAGKFTFDITGCPKGIQFWTGVVRDVSGSQKSSGINVSGRTVTVSNSIAASGTIAASDTAKVLAVCKQ